MNKSPPGIKKFKTFIHISTFNDIEYPIVYQNSFFKIFPPVGLSFGESYIFSSQYLKKCEVHFTGKYPWPSL